jgi:hypothetical protein
VKETDLRNNPAESMSETERLFEGGTPNPRRFGFFSIRSSSGEEPPPERVQEASRLLGREPIMTDKEGYECELLAAAISSPDRLAYVESRAKDVGSDPYGAGGRSIDISIRIHLFEKHGPNRSADIESYNPFFGCDIRFFEWVGDTAVLIYREKHWTFVCRFGAQWPPIFVKIEDDWVLHGNQLAYLAYKGEFVQRLSFPDLAKLEPLSKDTAKTYNLLP